MLEIQHGKKYTQCFLPVDSPGLIRETNTKKGLDLEVLTTSMVKIKPKTTVKQTQGFFDFKSS